MLKRREVLLGMVSATALASLSPGLLAQPRQGCFISAANTAAGEHRVLIADVQGRVVHSLEVAERCHAGCARPASDEVAFFSRRPGRQLNIIDAHQGRLVQVIGAEPGEHFYGHGVFSPDGKQLYATAHRYEDSEGVINVYAADQSYRLTGQIRLGVMDPHEVRLHPNGRDLVIAAGGIQTHPDYGRIKLNLDRMQPALLVVDRYREEVTQRHQPSHHQLSIHHLDISPEGIVVAGYQFEGPEWEQPNLIAWLDVERQRFEEIRLPDTDQQVLRNYIASVVMDAVTGVAAITAPRGNRVVLLDYRQRRYLHSIELADVSGVLPLPEGGFICTSGMGGVYRLAPGSLLLKQVSADNIHWDNHLTRV
jgi:hypothetical protein